MSDSEKISAAWYIAFFLVGILLGLLLLRTYDVAALIRSWGAEPGSAAEHSASAGKEQVKAAKPVTAVTPSPRKKPIADAEPEPSSPVAPATADAAATEPPPAEVAPVPEPFVCNQKRASAIRDKAREMAEIVTYSDHLAVRLRGEWAYYSDSVRRSFITKFADSDACLNGRSRQIRFFYQGKLYATADPEKGVAFE